MGSARISSIVAPWFMLCEPHLAVDSVPHRRAKAHIRGLLFPRAIQAGRKNILKSPNHLFPPAAALIGPLHNSPYVWTMSSVCVFLFWQLVLSVFFFFSFSCRGEPKDKFPLSWTIKSVNQSGLGVKSLSGYEWLAIVQLLPLLNMTYNISYVSNISYSTRTLM